MSELLRLIPASREREWMQWIDPLPHDFYHTAAYHRFSEQSGEGEAWLAVFGSQDQYLAWPYLLRPVPAFTGAGRGLRDVTSVYGYAGPLVRRAVSADSFLERARKKIGELWLSQNVITAFSRFHPLLENHQWAEPPLTAPGSGCVREAGLTVSIDLVASERDNWHGYQASLRNRIRRGRRLGLVSSVDEAWSRLPDFVRFYHATMARNHATPYYFFTVEYFQRLRDALGSRAVLMLTRLGTTVAAAGIFVEYRGIVQNHFCVNNPECLSLAPSKVLLDDVRRWASARGNSVFHLGGGRSGSRDSLFAFKSAFSPRRHVFHTGQWILNGEAYQQLCGARSDDRAALPLTGFFPAYRAAESARSVQTI
jgi:hypothetical protein